LLIAGFIILSLMLSRANARRGTRAEAGLG